MKINLTEFKAKMFERLMRWFGMHNYYANSMRQAINTIQQLKTEVSRFDAKLDTNTSLNVRSQLSLVDFDKLGEIVWIKVADKRMLRQATWTQIRDFMQANGKASSILIVTADDVQLQSLTEEDLMRAGLARLEPRERQ